MPQSQSPVATEHRQSSVSNASRISDIPVSSMDASVAGLWKYHHKCRIQTRAGAFHNQTSINAFDVACLETTKTRSRSRHE